MAPSQTRSSRAVWLAAVIVVIVWVQAAYLDDRGEARMRGPVARSGGLAGTVELALAASPPGDGLATIEDLGYVDTEDLFPKDDHLSEEGNWSRLLFVTIHGSKGKGNNVLVYNYDKSHAMKHHWDLTGHALDEQAVKNLELQNLRGMKAVGDTLYIASAHSSTSKIIMTEKCSLKPRLAKTFAVKGLDHPYGIAYFRGRIFATNQNSDTVVYFNVNEARTAETPHKFATVRDPRGLVFDRFGRLWVASTVDGIFVLDGKSGKKLAHIKIGHPVGLALQFNSNTVFVGSVKDNCIYAIDTDRIKIKRTYTVNSPYKLHHPAGVTIVGNRLFAIGQNVRKLFAWHVDTGKFHGPILQNLPDRPEQVAVLRCLGQ
mmetsp:Transcript_1145/g.1759  ORF Transcript_1145/g.1759 Transcript_1145/m.1759 type:complete len:373 (-) Transcript_1145:158-1276(-)